MLKVKRNAHGAYIELDSKIITFVEMIGQPDSLASVYSAFYGEPLIRVNPWLLKSDPEGDAPYLTASLESADLELQRIQESIERLKRYESDIRLAIAAYKGPLSGSYKKFICPECGDEWVQFHVGDDVECPECEFILDDEFQD